MVNPDEVREALRRVIDPELGMNIVDLGLIYDIRTEGGEVEVELTLTSPGCPLAPVIDKMIKDEVGKVAGVEVVTIDLVWDPPWNTDMITPEMRAELGLD